MSFYTVNIIYLCVFIYRVLEAMSVDGVAQFTVCFSCE